MDMRRKVLATLAAGALAFGAMGFSPGNSGNAGGPGGPGPFGPNNFGLCTAWAANENGRENGRAGDAPPFAALQEAADEADQSVEDWCAENGQHPGNGNGRNG
jgi:hypothetical protein